MALEEDDDWGGGGGGGGGSGQEISDASLAARLQAAEQRALAAERRRLGLASGTAAAEPGTGHIENEEEEFVNVVGDGDGRVRGGTATSPPPPPAFHTNRGVEESPEERPDVSGDEELARRLQEEEERQAGVEPERQTWGEFAQAASGFVGRAAGNLVQTAVHSLLNNIRRNNEDETLSETGVQGQRRRQEQYEQQEWDRWRRFDTAGGAPGGLHPGYAERLEEIQRERDVAVTEQLEADAALAARLQAEEDGEEWSREQHWGEDVNMEAETSPISHPISRTNSQERTREPLEALLEQLFVNPRNSNALFRTGRGPRGFNQFVFPGMSTRIMVSSNGQGVQVFRGNVGGADIEARPGNPLDYESLLHMAEQLGGSVPHGASEEQISHLPTHTFDSNQAAGGSGEGTLSQCSICLSEYEAGEEIRTLPCLHMYHKDCIDHWLHTNRSCPVCKHEVTS